MVADKERIKYLSVLMALLCLALVLSARVVYLFLADSERFPIHTVKIVGSNQHISHQQIQLLLNKYLPYGFFALPVNHLYKDLEQFDWSKATRVERIWPDILKITVIEKVPVAIWNNSYMTESGEILKVGLDERGFDVPQLEGPSNQQLDVLHMYENLSKILARYGLHAALLKLRDNQAWELTLTNGVVLRLGKQDLQKRLTHFCKAYSSVFADTVDRLASVDLRYERGMAVQWKEQTG